jgi:hypothetical protein
MKLVEKPGHSVPLQFCVMKNGGPSTDVGILLFDSGGPSPCDDRSKEPLKRQWNKVPVHEEVLQEVVCFLNLKAGEDTRYANATQISRVTQL